MSRVRASALIVLSCLFTSCTTPSSLPSVRLIVLCDVSQSLKNDVIASEASVISDLLKDNTDRSLFPRGSFAVYIADGDVERHKILNGKKESFSYANQQPAIEQTNKFATYESSLRNELITYSTTSSQDGDRPEEPRSTSHSGRREQTRGRTCLLRSSGAAAALMTELPSAEGQERIIIVSDMLEDCLGEGDPKTPAELAVRLATAMKQYSLPDLKGVDIVGLALSTTNPIQIQDVRAAWTPIFAEAHAQFSLRVANDKRSQ